MRAIPSRANRPGLPRPRLVRAAIAVTASLVMMLCVGGCGMKAQTLKPYTPAEGVNVDVGNQADPNAVVHVRNLILVSKTAGSAVVSASMVTGGRDQLTGITGTPTKADGSAGAPFTAKLTNTVSLANGFQVLLTDSPITVTSPDIVPGLTASLTLQFANAGSVTLNTTVVDGNQPQYVSISPAPATATPTA